MKQLTMLPALAVGTVLVFRKPKISAKNEVPCCIHVA